MLTKSCNLLSDWSDNLSQSFCHVVVWWVVHVEYLTQWYLLSYFKWDVKPRYFGTDRILSQVVQLIIPSWFNRLIILHTDFSVDGVLTFSPLFIVNLNLWLSSAVLLSTYPWLLRMTIAAALSYTETDMFILQQFLYFFNVPWAEVCPFESDT